ncbi:chitobiase/beta-hexosaminidase C-terminal domain-containing protein [Clostridium sp. YIM B02555]|uniref:chitobiase/beta-hexosaminidase C-terminal domain-containing protein n=1 Tax=Clostridium sp. YIM B02555 TaxID=2911968 RepID=UPI001EED97F0
MPALSVAAGTYSSAQTVTISSKTSGEAIYYTTDGSIPTTLSTVYKSPITISKTTILKAIAIKSGELLC